MLEFLIESVILCIVGGVFGLALVYIAMFALSYGLTSFEFVLSLNNILLGLGLSIFIGILAGMIPASQASISAFAASTCSLDSDFALASSSL